MSLLLDRRAQAAIARALNLSVLDISIGAIDEAFHQRYGEYVFEYMTTTNTSALDCRR